MDDLQNKPADPGADIPGAPPPVATLTDNPAIRTILAKRAAKQKLTPKESGKLGGFLSRAGLKLPGPVPDSPGDLAAAPSDGSVSPPGDPDYVRNVAESILGSTDGLAAWLVSQKAKDLGADTKYAQELGDACKMAKPTRESIIKAAPDACAALGVRPEATPLGVIAIGFAAWGAQLAIVLKKLEKLEGVKKSDSK